MQVLFSDLAASKARPVIVFKDNLPFDDFVGIPISSKIERLYADETILDPDDVTDGVLPKRSKVMVRKTFVISKSVIMKKYGVLRAERFERLKRDFCHYFDC